ncbi:hypothetical protein SAMN05216249_104143 [Acetitomaculum ruminis DSM 5522]|uniref:Lipoprotein n=1 Tax=Acetitomaculum ruminis DSM 5522 TaxID=1120918 RepID=A0A1I0WKY0_9FIRM|nr:hypothetical protein [Acetitomaculum ruminis]SFA89455.1 hypothetical protein SAMN05216249_104143 [Acetitomaculum ruminis DSM 5522]
MKKKIFITLFLIMIFMMFSLTACQETKIKEEKEYKPVIYLYPKEETDVSVSLDYAGDFTCLYPEFSQDNTWKVRAYPDGSLKDASGETYNYLFWEGESDIEYDFSRGYCIKGEDTKDFLEDELKKLGLNRKEANEFIVFWLPKMKDNKYNVISFQKEAYTDNAKLKTTPETDSQIRVFMAWYDSDTFVEIKKPKEENCPQRKGFTLVEWGGCKVK